MAFVPSDMVGQLVGILLDGRYPFSLDWGMDRALVSICALAGVVRLLVSLILSASVFVIV